MTEQKQSSAIFELANRLLAFLARFSRHKTWPWLDPLKKTELGGFSKRFPTAVGIRYRVSLSGGVGYQGNGSGGSAIVQKIP